MKFHEGTSPARISLPEGTAPACGRVRRGGQWIAGVTERKEVSLPKEKLKGKLLIPRFRAQLLELLTVLLSAFISILSGKKWTLGLRL